MLRKQNHANREHDQKARRKVYVPENARRNKGIVGRKQVDLGHNAIKGRADDRLVHLPLRFVHLRFCLFVGRMLANGKIWITTQLR
jgi:hypothetical protein